MGIKAAMPQCLTMSALYGPHMAAGNYGQEVSGPRGVGAFTHIPPALATPVPADTAAVSEPSFKRSFFGFGIMGMQLIKIAATSRSVTLVSFIWM
jgi:hypothetical protein